MKIRRKARDEWLALMPNAHEGYVSWEKSEAIRMMVSNNVPTSRHHGAPKHGDALLAGLIRCRRCGRKLTLRYTGTKHSIPRYSCSRGWMDNGEPRCIAFGGLRVDDAIEDALLGIVGPGAIAAAVAAEQEGGQRRDQVRAAFLRDLEAARYTADRAFRQYDATDPANRLVAGELEARWNKALARVAEVESKIVGHDAARPMLAPDPASLATLATDLKTVWAAPTTDARLKKRIVRTLIQEVIADIDPEAAEIILVVHWIGGVHSEIRLPRRRRGQRNSTSADIIVAVRQLALIANDDLIAGILNRNGLVTGHGNRWTRERVTSLRSHHRIPVFKAADDGIEPWLNLSKAAQLLEISPKTLRLAAQAGEISAVHPLAGWSLDLQPRRSLIVSSARHRRRRPAQSQIPHGIASRSAKPILFNHIDRWVFRCMVVVPAPALDQHLGFTKAGEDLAVQQFVPELRVEALAVTVLPGTPRLDEQGLHAEPAKPLSNCLGCELRPIVRTYVLWWSMLDEQVGQAVQHVVGPEPPSHHDRQAAPGKLVDHAQHAERPAILRSVLDEVVGPDMVRPARAAAARTTRR